MDKNKKTNKQPTNKKNDSERSFTNAVEPTNTKKDKRNNNGAQNCR